MTMPRKSFSPVLGGSSQQRNHVGWPIGSAGMAALTDLGLSDEEIARYFETEPAAVTVLRHRYGIESRRTES